MASCPPCWRHLPAVAISPSCQIGSEANPALYARDGLEFIEPIDGSIFLDAVLGMGMVAIERPIELRLCVGPFFPALLRGIPGGATTPPFYQQASRGWTLAQRHRAIFGRAPRLPATSMLAFPPFSGDRDARHVRTRGRSRDRNHAHGPRNGSHDGSAENRDTADS